MSKLSKSAVQLNTMIKTAIHDEKITPWEREQIMMLADEDGIIDSHEKALLGQLQDMIQSGAIKLMKE
ncbi:tRNA lysidine(34) synthetase TilS C-terminal domain-containing protein [Mariprofundus ferrooxydans]|uniref:tRNA lysidine(34) synthetase TilS C-terminal domain-containing protein n=1 Tax=Mariprofundus ferrooxydans TaxID=314344 RepID=UPI001431B758|nr:tRNA lysidine(34) synthetase TilS C-terminal domain-containing protein [Mariprofundus ferrooxydans]